MRAVAVVIVSFTLSLTLLIYSYHGFVARGSWTVIVLGLSALGIAFGALAGWWDWVVRHPVAYLCSSFGAAMLILLPFLAASLGGAIVLFPLVVLWVGRNLLGLLVTRKIRSKKTPAS
jgi:hypothetical protein